MSKHDDIKQSVQQHFANTAANYSVSAVHAKGADLAVMVERAGLHGGEKILDAGCGAGHTGLAFAPHVAHVTAYDLTPAMLREVERLAAERGIGNITTHQGDVEALPFPDAVFDCVVTRYSAHHWPNPQAALREIARVLKPDGQFLLSDSVAPEAPAHDSFMQTFEVLRDTSHVRDHSVTQWEAMLAECGFAAEVLDTWDIGLDFEDWVRRMATPELNTAMIKALFDGAPADLRAAFHIEDNYHFTIPAALLRGRLSD